MKNKGLVATGLVIVTIAVVVVIVASLVGSAAFKAEPATPTSVGTNQPLLTFTPDPCTTENMSVTIAGIEKLSREFEDTYNVAALTPSTQLTPLITDLQRVRREAEDYPIPACLQVLKQYQIDTMNSYIEALKALIAALQVNVQPVAGMTQAQYDQAVQEALGQYYALANQYIAQASDLSNKYIIEKARLLGVTLPPTLTAQPTIAPATGTP